MNHWTARSLFSEALRIALRLLGPFLLVAAVLLVAVDLYR